MLKRFTIIAMLLCLVWAFQSKADDEADDQELEKPKVVKYQSRDANLHQQEGMVQEFISRLQMLAGAFARGKDSISGMVSIAMFGNTNQLQPRRAGSTGLNPARLYPLSFPSNQPKASVCICRSNLWPPE